VSQFRKGHIVGQFKVAGRCATYQQIEDFMTTSVSSDNSGQALTDAEMKAKQKASKKASKQAAKDQANRQRELGARRRR
jgi:hypothetical protein